MKSYNKIILTIAIILAVSIMGIMAHNNAVLKNELANEIQLRNELVENYLSQLVQVEADAFERGYNSGYAHVIEGIKIEGINPEEGVIAIGIDDDVWEYTYIVTVEEVEEEPNLASFSPLPQANGSLGYFSLTAYCGCTECCGQYSNGITATGTTATEGRTIAVDPSVIKYGSHVTINGNEYIAEDCGGGVKGNHIDIFFANHDDALAFGRRNAEVFLVG